MPERNFANRTLYHGDNFDFLKGMNSETVNLIATDPPFNKSKDFHATPNSLARGPRFVDRWAWECDVHQEWVYAIVVRAAKRTGNLPNTSKVSQGKAAVKKLLQR